MIQSTPKPRYWFLLSVIFMSFVSHNPQAKAAYRAEDALTTIAVSTGIGGVIGLSTLPFYSTPTSHMSNVVMGAGAGLLLGIGIAAYQFSQDEESTAIDPDEILIPPAKPTGAPGQGGSEGADKTKKPQASKTREQVGRYFPRVVFNTDLNNTMHTTEQSKRWLVYVEVPVARF